MELMQSDVLVRSTARRLFALLTAAVAFAIPRHVPIALRTLDALLIQAAAGRARAMPGPGKIQRRIKLAFIANPGAPLTIAEGGERAA